MDGTGPLAGRVALVTGGASGLGRATCVALGEAGAHVVIADIDAAGSEETRGLVTGRDGSAQVVALDVTDDDLRREVVAELFGEHGNAFDILVNVAGIDRPGYITDIDLADYRQVQAVNCEGPIFLTSEFMKRAQELPEVRAESETMCTTSAVRPSGKSWTRFMNSLVRKTGPSQLTAWTRR